MLSGSWEVIEKRKEARGIVLLVFNGLSAGFCFRNIGSVFGDWMGTN